MRIENIYSDGMNPKQIRNIKNVMMFTTKDDFSTFFSFIILSLTPSRATNISIRVQIYFYKDILSTHM